MRVTHLPTGMAVAVQQQPVPQPQSAPDAEGAPLRARAAEARGRAPGGRGQQDHRLGPPLRPYQMVKDLRTGVERSDPQKVLDGDLDEFLAALLAARVGKRKDKEAA